MTNLATKYMGLDLQNPFIVASSSLANTVEGVQRCADHGAGAVVLKSLFEEQINVSRERLEEETWLPGHPEAFEYLEKMTMELGPNEYLKLVSDAKKKVSIPIIASLNCISPKWWAEYAKRIEVAGADGLEINLSIMPSDLKRTGTEIENLYFDIFENVKETVGIPIAVKIAPYFTSIARIADKFARYGAAALVLFNRYYQLDIDIETIELTSGMRFSSPDEFHVPLRWIALLAERVECDLASSTGVHDGESAIKLLLAGASAVQICSTLYINGFPQIGRMIEQMETWMGEHKFTDIDSFRGKLSQLESDRPELYERLQYIKVLVGIE